jgi:hypothetical protein
MASGQSGCQQQAEYMTAPDIRGNVEFILHRGPPESLSHCLSVLSVHRIGLLHRNRPALARAALGHKKETKTEATPRARHRSPLTLRPAVIGMRAGHCKAATASRKRHPARDFSDLSIADASDNEGSCYSPRPDRYRPSTAFPLPLAGRIDVGAHSANAT